MDEPRISPSLLPLASRLRQQTRLRHAEVERSGMMAALLRGNVSRRGYNLLLRNLFAIYDALESALDAHLTHPVAGRVALPVLYRSAALADDLATLHGEDWREAIPMAATTVRYAGLLREHAQHAPELLVAHAYVRYLGDLSGGQVLREIVARMLSVDGAAGLAFYTFPDPGAAALARTFRDALDSTADNDGTTFARIVAEADAAFTLHRILFEEFAGMDSAAVSPN